MTVKRSTGTDGERANLFTIMQRPRRDMTSVGGGLFSNRYRQTYPFVPKRERAADSDGVSLAPAHSPWRDKKRAFSMYDWSRLQEQELFVPGDFAVPASRLPKRWPVVLATGGRIPALVIQDEAASLIVEGSPNGTFKVIEVVLYVDVENGRVRRGEELGAPVYTALIPRPIIEIWPIGKARGRTKTLSRATNPWGHRLQGKKVFPFVSSTCLTTQRIVVDRDGLGLLRDVKANELSIRPIDMTWAEARSLKWTLGQRKWPPESFYR